MKRGLAPRLLCDASFAQAVGQVKDKLDPTVFWTRHFE